MLNEKCSRFRYFGKGPGETYADMQNYQGYGLWESKASKEYVPYIMPQEHGNHYGTRYLELDNGMTFVADKAFEINVSSMMRKTPEEIEQMSQIRLMFHQWCQNVQMAG